MKKSAIMVMLFGAAFAATSATITVDNVQQRWPWNNKVDITYTITGDDLAGKVGKVTLTTIINGASYTVYDGPVGDAKVGTFTVTWENPPAGVNCNDCRMRATLNTCPVREGNDYMIVELKTGEVTYEGLFLDTDDVCGISGQALSNARYNVDKYKTTHLVLRKVPKGTYKTGDSVNCATGGDRNNDATWTTDREFYIAVFPWTTYQYWEILDLQDGKVGHIEITPRQMAYVGDIRGNDNPLTPPTPRTTQHWPILEWLNGKTGMTFDLPTEVMFEIALRAGTTTTYFWGDDFADAAKYAVYNVSSAQPVGSKLPNNWGLYDMSGGTWEWVLDIYVSGQDLPTHEDAFTPFVPKDAETGEYLPVSSYVNRRVRPGHWTQNSAAWLRAAQRSGGSKNSNYGFRIAYIVPNSEE